MATLLHHLRTESAVRQPDAVAFRFPSKASLTYAELEAQANKLAQTLIGAFTIAGERLASYNRTYEPAPKARKAAPRPKAAAPKPKQKQARNTQRITDELPDFMNGGQPTIRKRPVRTKNNTPAFVNRRKPAYAAPQPKPKRSAPMPAQTNRVKNRPPMPRGGGARRAPMLAKSNNKFHN